jgi:dipeptidyl aminopeptidase/acylaminoacyl peptidase
MLMKHLRIPALLVFLSLSVPSAFGAAPRVEQGNLIYDGIPVEQLDAVSTLPRWQESRSAGFLDWLADGSLLVTTRFGDAAQLHRVRAPLGMREQLTWESEPLSSAVAHPTDANLLLYRKDRGGDENMQIWLHDISKNTDRLLTDGKSRHGPPVFAHDGKRIAFYGNAREPSSNDIYVSDITSEAAPRLVLAGSGDALYVQDWYADDSRLAVIRYRSSTDSELLLVDVATGKQTPVEPAAGYKGDPVSVGVARFSRDGRGIYFTSDRGGEFSALHYMDLFTRQMTTLTPGTSWDITNLELSGDNRFLAYTRNEAGIDRLVLHDLARKADVLLPPLPSNAVIGGLGFDHAGRRLAVSLDTAQSPADVYVYSLDTAAADTLPQVALARWTQSELGPLDASRLVAAQLVEFPTWDRVGNRQRMLSAFVYKPAGPGPHPVLIDIHGGPESQFQPGWNAFRQYLVNELGYAVIAPNVRGSWGYGRSFLKLDDAELREDSVRDIGALLVWIGLQGELDRQRVVATGGSYGGYMVLASLVQYSDRLAGGIDMVGISNFVTFLTNTSGYRRDLRRVEYGDERDPKMRALLQSISPLTNVASIKKPLLIVQGLNDPRVPASESEQMMRTLRARGNEVWYLAAKDEGHGFRRKSNNDAYRATVVAFLKHIAGR